jgi:uncharacterized protein YecT (DUF1311 family)
LAIGIRPPTESSDSPPTTRHPRLVHDEMEAIFGVPSSLNTVKRGQPGGVNTHVEPDVASSERLRSVGMWAGALILFCLLSFGAYFLARSMSGGGRPPAESVQVAVTDPAGPAPLGPVEWSASTPVVSEPPAEKIVPAPIVPPPAAPPVVATAVDLPVGPAAADPSAAPTTDAKAEAPKNPACNGTSYEHMTVCPPSSVLKADRALSAAYTAAISANVDRERLGYYSQRWSQLRENAAGDPESTVDEFTSMVNQLNALTLAQASGQSVAKK